MKKLVTVGHYSDNDDKANERYVNHCKNIATILAGGVAAGKSPVHYTVSESIEAYFQLTQAYVVEA